MYIPYLSDFTVGPKKTSAEKGSGQQKKLFKKTKTASGKW